MKTMILILILLVPGTVVWAQHPRTRLPATDHKTVVIAHRGDHENVPENTLAAYRQAIVCGADYVEVDLRTTRDGRFVVMHDATVDRTTDGKGEVKALKYRDIRKLKIYGTRNGDPGTYRVPGFKEVLKTCRDHINIYLDFKSGDVRRAYRLMKKSGMQDHVVVYLNNEEQYKAWKQVAPGLPLMASLPESMDLGQLDSLLDKKEISVVDNAYREERIEFLHARGIAVWSDVESEGEGPAVWQKMLDSGADGLQTDHPRELIGYLTESNRR